MLGAAHCTIPENTELNYSSLSSGGYNNMGYNRLQLMAESEGGGTMNAAPI